MMKGICALILFVTTALVGGKTEPALVDVFPTMDGWSVDGDVSVYAADNLWEYIDGAAELYLTYHFREMGVASYVDDGGRSVTVEIYRHESSADAFGIYSQERPHPMNAVEVGAQGYYSRGVLNFCQGRHYVKLSGYELEESDESVLNEVAKIVSARVGGERDLPAALRCLPAQSRVASTERYIAQNLFGHRFLHSAFVARYRVGGDTTSLGFIIEAADTAEANGMLEGYRVLVEKHGRRFLERGGVYRFEDPVSRTAGTLNVKQRGRYLWGFSTNVTPVAEAFLTEAEDKLEAAGLID